MRGEEGQRSIPAGSGRGTLVGLALAALDLAGVAVFRVDALSAPEGLARAFLLLPALGALLGALAVWLPSWSWAGAVGLVCGLLTRDALTGAKAASWAFAGPAPYAVGILALIVTALRHRFPGGRRSRVVVWGFGALASYTLCAWPWHGHYHEPRRWLLVLAAVLAGAALGGDRKPLAATGARGRVFATVLVAVALMFATAGALRLREQVVAEWAEASTTALGILSRETSGWARSRRRAPAESAPAVADLESASSRALSAVLARRRSGPPGVLIVVIDALREDVVDRDLGGRAIMPRLRARAATGFRFRRHYAAAPYSLLSLNALFRGVSPGRLLTEEGSGAPFLAERARQAGGEIHSVFSRRLAPVTPGFPDADLGFGVASEAALRFDLADPPVDEIVARLAPSNPERPWLAYLHLMGPHAPYEDPRGRAGPTAGPFDRYLAEVAEADAKVDEILNALLSPAAAGRTLVILTADHGEEFREHGRLFHGHNLYAESVHVPLFVWGPGIVSGESTRVVSALDLAPTIDQWMGWGALGRPAYSGRSLLELMTGGPDVDRDDAALIELPERGERSFPARASLVTPRWSFTRDDRRGRRYLFDLLEDPGERNNLARVRPEIAAELEARLRRRRGRVPPARAVFPEATRYRKDAASRGALREFLRRHHESLEIPFVARALALMGIGPRDAADRSLVEEFVDHPSPEIARSARIVLASFAGASPAEIRTLARSEDDAIVLAAAEVALEARGDRMSGPDLDRESGDRQYDGVRVAARLERLGGPASDDDLSALGALFAEGEGWFFDRLRDLVRQRGGAAAVSRLREALVEGGGATEAVLRAILRDGG